MVNSYHPHVQEALPEPSIVFPTPLIEEKNFSENESDLKRNKKIVFEHGNVQVSLLTQATDREEVGHVIRFFEEIVTEQSWQSGDELRAYPDSSKYFVFKVGGCLAGALQLVTGNSDEGLPCLKVWPELGLHGRKDVADLALIALRPEYRDRSQNSFWCLWMEAWRYGIHHNITEFWAEITPRKHKIYWRMGLPLLIEGSLRVHWGAPSYPVKCSLETYAENMKARSEKSQIYKNIVTQMYRDQPHILNLLREPIETAA